MNIYDEAIVKLLYGNEQQKEFIIKALERAKKVEELAIYYKYKSQAYRDDDSVIQDIPQIEWDITRLEKELGELK